METFLLSSYRLALPTHHPSPGRTTVRLRRVGVLAGPCVVDLSRTGGGCQELRVLGRKSPAAAGFGGRVVCQQPLVGLFVGNVGGGGAAEEEYGGEQLKVEFKIEAAQKIEFQKLKKNLTGMPEGLKFEIKVSGSHDKSSDRLLLSLDSISSNDGLQMNLTELRLLIAILGNFESVRLVGNGTNFTLFSQQSAIGNWEAKYRLHTGNSFIKIGFCLTLLNENELGHSVPMEVFNARAAVCLQYAETQFQVELGEDSIIDGEIQEILEHPNVRQHKSTPSGQTKITRLLCLINRKISIYEEICELFPEVLQRLINKFDFCKLRTENLWGKDHTSYLERCTITQNQFLGYLRECAANLKEPLPNLQVFCALILLPRFVEICQKGYLRIREQLVAKPSRFATTEPNASKFVVPSAVLDSRMHSDYQYVHFDQHVLRMRKSALEVAQFQRNAADSNQGVVKYSIQMPFR